MTIDVDEIMSQLDPKRRDQLNREFVQTFKGQLPRLVKEYPEEFRQLIVEKIGLSEILEVLSPQEQEALAHLLNQKRDSDTDQEK